MQRRKLGGQGLEVSAQGLGCMGMTWAYGGGDEQSGLDTIGRALELGVTFLDTAEVYGPFTNERLVSRAIAGRRDQFAIATKFGFRFDPDDPYASRRLDGSPENVKRACEGSLERLGTDYIDLFTSTVSIRRCRSRRPSARWRIWSRRARCATSVSRRRPPT